MKPYNLKRKRHSSEKRFNLNPKLKNCEELIRDLERIKRAIAQHAYEYKCEKRVKNETN